jgi:hypothetical protein
MFVHLDAPQEHSVFQKLQHRDTRGKNIGSAGQGKEGERVDSAAWSQLRSSTNLPRYGHVAVSAYWSSEKTRGQGCPAASQSVSPWSKTGSQA